MPTYEYKCRACGRSVDIFHSITEAPRRKCPSCGKNALERQIGTGSAVLFKGSGFYQTDYRSESYKKGAESEAKPPADAKAKTGDGKADAKPEAKPAPAPESTPKPAEKRKRKSAE
jgi:putative FmdB family regulatory protein